MSTFRKYLIVAACMVVVAACGGTAGDTTTSTTGGETTTTGGSDTTTPSEPTSTTSADTTTSTTAGSEGTSDLSALQTAMANSADSGPARIEGVMSMVGVEVAPGQTVDVEMPISVTTDAATGNTAMSMDFGAMAEAMGGTEEMPEGMGEMMGAMEMRQIDDVVYLKFPFFTMFLGAQTDWISMPAEGSSDLTSSMGTGGTPSDPTSFLDSLSEADGTVEELGSEEVRGISTTHYRVTVEENWQDELSAEDLADLEAQGPLPDTSFPFDLWVDGDGLVHRMAMEVDGSEMTAEEGADEFQSMTMTFDFFDFGESVTIEPPPADQVTDMTELSGAFGGTTP